MVELNEYFPEEVERINAMRFIKVFYQDMLLDEEISDVSAVVLVVYMVANQAKTNKTDKVLAQKLFERLGRSSQRFSKALYEAVNRKKPALIKNEGDSLGLTFAGKEVIEKMLGDNFLLEKD